MRYQYSMGQLVTITVNTLDQFGHPVVPDFQLTPTYNLFFESPNGQIQIMNNMLTVPMTPTAFYANIDTTYLSVGSYTAVFNWLINGIECTTTTYFDVLQFDGAVLAVIDPISRLRIRLNDMDIDPQRWVFSDTALSEFLQDALYELNSAPPLGNYYWFNVPLNYTSNILMAAEAMALQALAIKVAHSPVTYSDKGVVVNLQSQAATYQNISNILRDKSDAERLRIKRTSSAAYSIGYIIQAGLTGFINTPPLRAFGRSW